MLGIGRRQKSALMVVEPPGNLRRTGILKVDDRVLVTVELVLVEQSAGAVNEAGELDFGIVADALQVEARKQGGRRGTVKAFVVIEHPHSQGRPRSFLDFFPPKPTLQAWVLAVGKS